MRLRGRHWPNTRDLVLDHVEKHPGQRPRDIHQALVHAHPDITYDMISKALFSLSHSGDVYVRKDGPHSLYHPVHEPAPNVPWVNPIRARYLRLTGAMS